MTSRHHAGACPIFNSDRDRLKPRRVRHPQHPSSRRQPVERNEGSLRSPHALADRAVPRPFSGSRAVSGCLQLRQPADGAEPLRHVAPGAPHIRVQPRSSGAHPGNPSVSRQRRKEKKFAGRVITTRSRSSPSRIITDRASPTSFQTQAMSNPYGGANQFMYPGYMVRALPPQTRRFQKNPPDICQRVRQKRKFHPHFFLTPTPRHPPEPFLSSGI